jgi:hypothetical protein
LCSDLFGLLDSLQSCQVNFVGHWPELVVISVKGSR